MGEHMTSLLSTVGNFLLSEWLWSVTFAWSYAGLNLITSTIVIRYIVGAKLLRACVLAILANSFSWFMYWMVIGYMMVHYLQWWAISRDTVMILDPLWANGYLAMIHTFLQIIFFYGVSLYYNIPMKQLLVGTFMSNGLAVLLSYGYITAVFKDLL
jgi:hypothetical protein